ncbi:hypothetical protein [Chryseobacterium sp.]|uniref:hypothetical protein n=1 Tax=Chryseobacterium sp. TaxID=1871047 RepID=UPI000EE9F518|nr:hypothetical protein [Chryseobacterium sp.]HCA06934.1 hypothetical protein [Chryseobacterium sp.]
MSTEKITNKELFEELKNRGFFVFPKEIRDDEIPDCFVVSVENPKKDIYITWQINPWNNDGIIRSDSE